MLKDHNLTAMEQFKDFDGEFFEDTIYDVARWAEERNITEAGGATSYSQLKKLREEIDEFEKAETDQEAFLEFGDMLVVCCQIARLRGIDMDDALFAAYDKIRDRKGRMENGVFVKEQQ